MFIRQLQGFGRMLCHSWGILKKNGEARGSDQGNGSCRRGTFPAQGKNGREQRPRLLGVAEIPKGKGRISATAHGWIAAQSKDRGFHCPGTIEGHDLPVVFQRLGELSLEELIVSQGVVGLEKVPFVSGGLGELEHLLRPYTSFTDLHPVSGNKPIPREDSKSPRVVPRLLAQFKGTLIGSHHLRDSESTGGKQGRAESVQQQDLVSNALGTVRESGVGEVVLTNLLYRDTVFVRYRTGDYAELETAADGAQRLTRLWGREPGSLRFRTRQLPTELLTERLGFLPGIGDFQVVTRPGEDTMVRWTHEAGDEGAESAGLALREAVKELLPDERVTFSQADRITPPGGKKRRFVWT